jgi:hypothetical protein
MSASFFGRRFLIRGSCRFKTSVGDTPLCDSCTNQHDWTDVTQTRYPKPSLKTSSKGDEMIFVHAVTLLIVALSPIFLWMYGRAAHKPIEPAFFKNILYVIPFLIVSCISFAFLSIHGGPASEWAIPTFVIIAAALIAPSPSSMRAYSICIFLICIALCGQGLWLRENGYTSDPAMTTNAGNASSRAILNSIRTKIEKQQLAADDLPKPLSELTDQEIPKVETLRLVTEWHTPITGLFKITRDKENIWVTGLNGSSPQLETKPL